MKHRFFQALTVLSFLTFSLSPIQAANSEFSLTTGTWDWQACDSSLVSVQVDVDLQLNTLELVRYGAWHRGQQVVVSYQMDLSSGHMVKEVADLVSGKRVYATQTNLDPADKDAYRPALVDMQYMIAEVLEQPDYCQPTATQDWQLIQTFLDSKLQAFN
ncbi:MAG: hypothetical protein ACOH5I_04140 [Oligoflexus sp.]